MSTLTGTGTLLRLALRRERIRLPVWVLGIVGIVLTNASSFPEVFPTAADRQARAALMATPATVALTGPGHGIEDYTYGAMLANEGISFSAVLVALLSIFLMTRHLRAEEESGRAELLRAVPVGRHAAMAAALLTALCGYTIIGVLLVVALPASPSAVPLDGSILFTASVLSVGLVFVGVAAVTSQLTQFARAANGLAGAVLGAAYVARAIGDVGDGTLSWLSPIGWAQATRSFVDGRWWPLGLSVATAAAAVLLAGVLSNRRDVGAGMLAARGGPREASPRLASPLALAFRLQRTALLGWTAAMALLGTVYGSIAADVDAFAADNEMVREFLRITGQADFVTSFMATLLQLLALLAAAFAVQSTLRLRAEESAGRVEPLLTASVPRSRWTASHVTVAAAGSLWLLLTAGLTLGTTAAVSLGDAAWIPRLTGAALVHLPAVWLCLAVAVALFGFVPRLAAAAWVVVGYGVLVGLLGPVLGLPDRALELSPFGQIPALPAADLELLPLAVLLAISVGLVGAGVAAFRRRDLVMT